MHLSHTPVTMTNLWVEQISITLPGEGPVMVETKVSLDESDEAIACRLAPKYPLGTVIGVSGLKWRSVSLAPVRVVPVVKGVPAPETSEAVVPTAVENVGDNPVVAPGQVWRPRDLRRKSDFKVKAVRGDIVEAEDGRTVQLERMKRYTLVP